MNPEPFWLDTAPRFRGGAAGGVDGRADVVVVGGGLTGLAAARALARRGASVVVLGALRASPEVKAALAARIR